MTPDDTKNKKLQGVNYVISDWDGTLVDSMPVYTDCFTTIMEDEFNIDPKQSAQYYMSTVGEALSKQIKQASVQFANSHVDDTTELETKFFQQYRRYGNVPVIDGAKETLDSLKSRGLKIIVWSGTRTDVLGDKLKQTGFDRLIDFYIGNEPNSDTLVKGPGLFEKIAERFSIPIEQLQQEAIVIGDGVGDMIAGKKSGAKTVGVLKTISKEKLNQAGADFIINSIEELPALIA